MRYAIYARYSSDLQSANSIEDQVRLARERVAQLGGTVTDVYADAAISGSHALTRPALQGLLADARAGLFDAVLAEAMDRISRDQEDIAAIFKRLNHLDIRIVTLSEGEVNELHVGLKGTMNALFLKDLAQKVRRGQRGRAEAGRNPGGICYGYKLVREIGPDGLLILGHRELDAAQAEIVQRIFREYVTGRSPRAIALSLNRDGVKAPRGGTWAASSIIGSRRRRSGILWNELYIGRMTYNRQTFRKDPETGRRVPKVNPRAQWIVVEVPELRILDDRTWARAMAIKEAAGAMAPHNSRRPKRLLAGLVRCGVCGGPYTLKDSAYLSCSNRRYRLACTNSRTVLMDSLERRTLAKMKEELLAPALIDAYVRHARASAMARRRSAAQAIAVQAGRVRDLDAKIRNAVDAIGNGADSEALRVGLAKWEAERDAIRSAAAGAERAAPVDLLPNLAEGYRRQVTALQRALSAHPETKAAAALQLRALIEKVVVTPRMDQKRGVEEWLYGRLAGILRDRAGATPVLGVLDGSGGVLQSIAPEEPATKIKL